MSILSLSLDRERIVSLNPATFFLTFVFLMLAIVLGIKLAKVTEPMVDSAIDSLLKRFKRKDRKKR